MSNPQTGQVVQSLSPPHKNSAAAKTGNMLQYETAQGHYQGRNVNSHLGNYMSHNDKLLLAHQR